MQKVKETFKIELDEDGEWSGLCRNIDCPHNIGYQYPESLEDNPEQKYNCHLDGIPLSEDNYCLSYQTDIEYALERSLDIMYDVLKKNSY